MLARPRPPQGNEIWEYEVTNTHRMKGIKASYLLVFSGKVVLATFGNSRESMTLNEELALLCYHRNRNMINLFKNIYKNTTRKT